MINPFPDEAVRLFLANAENGTRYLFAVCNAQRSVVMADDGVGGLVEVDRRIIDATLASCWAVAEGAVPARLTEHVAPLWGRMLPDWDVEYSPYNSAVNDALACLVHTIDASIGDKTEASSYFAANAMFELADHLLHRTRTDYVDDLAAEPITALAARCVIVDMEQLALDAIPVNIGGLRRRAIDEGRRIAALAS